MADVAKSPLHFLSHMRRGLGRLRDTQGGVEAGVTLSNASESEVLTRRLEIAGPEHVTGLSAAQVKRLVPSPDSADFAPNYFATIEFLLPDIPWMFSPSGPDAEGRLSPWMALVIVEANSAGIGAGVSVAAPRQDANGTLTLYGADRIARQLPDLSEAWAWAHVQSRADLAALSVEDAFAQAPDAFSSRLICPRRLEPMTDYVACVVPTTRGGVDAGLGRILRDEPHGPAWTGQEPDLTLPVYYSWNFKTARKGDFEDLVRRLTPVELTAGSVLMDLSDAGDPRLPQGGGAAAQVSFKGALVGTQADSKAWNKAHAAAFREGLEEILETHWAGEDEAGPQAYDATRDDPVVAPPAWGQRKIAADKPPALRDGGPEKTWFAQLNYDPRHRAAAGLGAAAVRMHQEPLMAEAWSQVEALREVNRKLNQAQLSLEVGKALKAAKVDKLSAQESTALSAGFKKRLGARFEQLKTAQSTQAAPQGVTTSALGRLGRRKGPLARKAGLKQPVAAAGLSWVRRDPAQALGYAAFTVPSGVSGNDMIAQLYPPDLPEDVASDLDSRLERTGVTAKRPRLSGALAVSQAKRPVTRKIEKSRGAAALKSSAISSAMTSGETGGDTGGATGSVSSAQAISRAADDVFDPEAVLSARLKATVEIDDTHFAHKPVPRPLLVEPQFDVSGYTMLRAISPDAVMPGVSEVEMNSVGLAQVNTDFVESWLVGANAEMAREFLWREYPARLDGTYFRRFWDSPDKIDDIDPISAWQKVLGRNQSGAAKDGMLVVLLRAEVLARFPELRVYATRALWDDRHFRKEDTDAPIAERIKAPVFGGRLDRRTAFYAFDLDLDVAKGDLDLMGPNPGWFFAFEQPPEGVQFGMDVPAAGDGPKPQHWADLTWSHALDEPDGSGAVTHASIARGVGRESAKYDLDMFRETWGRSASAQARITLQPPARVLMHASAMLP